MKNQTVVLIFFFTFLVADAQVAKVQPHPLFVSPLPQTSLIPSTPNMVGKQAVKQASKGIAKTNQTAASLAIKDIFLPTGFDRRTQSQGMYTKHFLTTAQTRTLLGISFMAVNVGVLLIKLEELVAGIAGIARLLPRPKPQLTIPYWDVLR
jgi:hypothetical protein